MSNNNTKPNLKADHGAHNSAQAGKYGLLPSFIIFMAWVAGIGLLLSLVACTPVNAKPIASKDSSGYYSVTTKLLAVKPSRQTLAIFMPRICLTTNQQINKGMNRITSVFIQARHIFSVTSANIYDGLIEPNKIPLVGNKLNRLVTVVKTCHPFFMGGNKLTKLLGAIHHG